MNIEMFFLDLPLKDCFDGVKERRGKTRSDIPWIETEEDSEFIKFIENFNNSQRPDILALLDKYSNKNIVIFKSREEVDDFIEHII